MNRIKDMVINAIVDHPTVSGCILASFIIGVGLAGTLGMIWPGLILFGGLTLLILAIYALNE